MWYLAEILFAEPRQPDGKANQCESCNVVFKALTAREAYRKAITWGENYIAESPGGMQLLGVSHLTSIGDELGDGVEICGRFFESADVWDRVAELVPDLALLKAIMWERNKDAPLAELLTSEQVELLKRNFRSENA